MISFLKNISNSSISNESIDQEDTTAFHDLIKSYTLDYPNDPSIVSSPSTNSRSPIKNDDDYDNVPDINDCNHGDRDEFIGEGFSQSFESILKGNSLIYYLAYLIF